MSNEYIILGIDPGTRITGYGVIKLSGRIHTALDFGCIRPSPKAEKPQRYRALYEGIEELIGKYTPHALSIETQFVYKNAQTALTLGMAKAMALLAAAKRDIPVFDYTPMQAKRAVVGTGAASKEQVQQMIRHLLRLSELPTPQDAADALALALCHAHQHCSPKMCHV